ASGGAGHCHTWGRAVVAHGGKLQLRFGERRRGAAIPYGQDRKPRPGAIPGRGQPASSGMLFVGVHPATSRVEGPAAGPCPRLGRTPALAGSWRRWTGASAVPAAVAVREE